MGAEICLLTGGVNLVELTLLGCEIAQFILLLYLFLFLPNHLLKRKAPRSYWNELGRHYM